MWPTAEEPRSGEASGKSGSWPSAEEGSLRLPSERTQQEPGEGGKLQSGAAGKLRQDNYQLALQTREV